MKNLTKAFFGTVAAGAMAATAVTPASAADRYRDRDRGIDAGDVIAGAAVLGGIAILAGALGNRDRDRYDYRDRRYRDRYDRRYSRYGDPRYAVEQCVRAAERDARRYGYRGADVTQIRDVDRSRYGYRVKGRIVVDENNYGYRSSRYDRYDRYDRRSRYRDRDYDTGSFSCRYERGRITDLDFSGIRGLR